MDKRRSKRVIKRLAVSFGDCNLQHTGITNDISKNGLFIKTTQFYSPGSVIKIDILIPNNGSAAFTGKVVRTYRRPPYSSLAGNGVGVELKLDPTEKAYFTFLRTFVEE